MSVSYLTYLHEIGTRGIPIMVLELEIMDSSSLPVNSFLSELNICAIHINLLLILAWEYYLIVRGLRVSVGRD